MDFSFFLFSFSAGLLSVFSPCVLPVLPIVIAGKSGESKLRPLLIVLGLSISFVSMGIISSIFGHFVADYIQSVEKISGIIIAIFGLLVLFNINLFKKMSFLQRINYQGEGAFSGIILGITLGIIWIPCVGPVLSSILTMVATANDFYKGALSLFIYSMGFSIPILVAGYSAHFFREKISFLQKNQVGVRIISGLLLLIFGIYVALFGLVGFSFS